MQTQLVPVADGVSLSVDTWAASGAPARGSAFVLVHGLASNARMWDGVAARLADRGHDALTVDLRGHGRSSKPDGPYDVATVAGDVDTLIATLGLDRPVVAGQSWGGNVVLDLAVRHAGDVRGVVCVDGGWLELARRFPVWEACRDGLAPPRLAGRHRDEVEAYIRSAHADWPETGIQGALGNFEVRADGTIAPWLTFDRHMAVLRGLWEHRPSARYAEVGAPVLLVPAEATDDTAGKRAAVQEALAGIPRARVCWIRGDHDIHAQHPVELADVMIEQLIDGFFA